MDGQRFDQMTRAMAGGATRRQALRLAGGGLAGALLAAVGLGRRVGAQESCDVLLARCTEEIGGACDGLQGRPYLNCLEEQGRACSGYLEACTSNCGSNDPSRRTCEGGCPQGGACTVALNAGSVIVCRCVSLD